MTERKLTILLAVAVLLLLNGMVAQKEHQLATGESIYFELAPVDPRSLMQGDYMRLDYAVAREAEKTAKPDARVGSLVVTVDERGVAQFARQGQDAGPTERIVRWKRKDNQLVVGADAFYFQEGQRDHFEAARFADIKVGGDGRTLLVGLLDADLKPL